MTSDVPGKNAQLILLRQPKQNEEPEGFEGRVGDEPLRTNCYS